MCSKTKYSSITNSKINALFAIVKAVKDNYVARLPEKTHYLKFA